jgi:hypothetical protein
LNEYQILFVAIYYLMNISLIVNSPFETDNLVAWCIIPYDSCERSPLQRVDMLKRLGFSKFAWDWRTEHLPTAELEFKVMKASGIEVVGVWMWIDREAVNGFSEEIHLLIESVLHSGLKTRLWIGFDPEMFENLNSEGDRLALVSSLLKKLDRQLQGSSVTMALYNHGGWSGEPDTMVSIIKSTGLESLGIVYNLHHAHHQITDLRKHLRTMLPYLVSINLNGMELMGPKIMDLGSGSLDTWVLETIRESGYRGHIGLLGHTVGEDVERVLERNLTGLASLLTESGNRMIH